MIQTCKPEHPTITVDWLLRRYKTEKSRTKLRPYYEELLADAERLVQPAVLCQEFALKEVAPLETWLPAGTHSVVLGVCTLGHALDGYIAQKSEEDMTSAVILNEIALAQINALLRSMHAVIREAGRSRELKAGPAFRPGVGRWPLETQNVIFERLSAEEIGVLIDDSYWMTPVKSTSVIIPLLEKGSLRHHDIPSILGK